MYKSAKMNQTYDHNASFILKIKLNKITAQKKH